MSENTRLRFTREEFHEKVWAKPARILAGEFGISDVMISKICKKHKIPKPGLGYWARVENGYNDPVTKLPPVSDPNLKTIEFTKNIGDLYRLELPNEINELLASEGRAELEVRIPKRIANHSEVADYFEVSNGQSMRASRIISALLSAFKKRRFDFSGGPKCTCSVKIRNTHVEFKLREQYRQVKSNKTESERRSLFESAVSLSASGLLYFQIESYTDSRCKKKWIDKPNLPLEEQLGDFIRGLIVASEAVRLHDERIKEMHRQWEVEREDARRRERERQARFARTTAVKKLAADVRDFCQVIELKGQVDKMKNSELNSVELTELTKWIDEYLSEMAPIPSFLDEVIRPLVDSRCDGRDENDGDN